MKLSLKVFVLLALFMSALQAQAQNFQWGTGMYGAVQSCPGGGQQVSAAVKESLKDFKEEERYKKDIQARLKKARDRDRIEKDLDMAKGDIEAVFRPQWSAHFLAHMDNHHDCMAYFPSRTCEGKSKTRTDATIPEGGEARCNIALGSNKKPADWDSICDQDNPGNVSTAACDNAVFTNDPITSKEKANCAPSLGKYAQLKAKMSILDRDITNLETLLDRAQSRVDKAKDRIQSDLESQTEGGVCIECLSQGNGGGDVVERKTDWGWAIANGLVGALAMYAGSKAEHNRAYYNAQLGFPTQQTYPTFMYGMPFFVNGLYGALNGGVAGGAFGCAGGGLGGGMGGPGGGGLWGYPGGMMGNPMGGGIFMPGMGGFPYGGMGFPGGMGMLMAGGMMMPGGYPMPGAMMMGGMPGMMMGGMPMGGMPMPGMMAAGGMMMPGMGGMMMPGGGMGGMMMPGMMMGGGMPMGGGMMMGMPGMMMAGGIMMGGGMPMGGMPMGGGMAMGGMPMAGGMPMGGMPMGGMPMAGGMMGGYPMSGGMMMGGGMPMGGGMMMGGGAMMGGMDMGMQMQMQMMQMQQQYMQQQMQMQMRIQENYMQRQRITAGLYQELQGLMMRISCVQSGTCGGGGSMLGVGGGIGGGLPGMTPGMGIQTPSFGPPGGGAPGAPSNNGNYVR